MLLTSFKAARNVLWRSHYLPVLVMVISAVLVLWRIHTSLGLPHYGDEDEKIVTVWMIADGYRLYDTIFAHHGPLNYLLALFVHLLTGSTNVEVYRLFQWLIIVMSGVALASSPIVSGWRHRIFVMSLYLILIAFLYPLWRGHLLLYHSHGGMLILVALGLLLIPLSLGIRPSSWQCGIGGACLSLSGMCAYSFGVSILLFLVAVVTFLAERGKVIDQLRPVIFPTMIGIGSAFGIVFIFLLLYGDLKGYVAYHLFFNQKVYSNFIDFHPLMALEQIKYFFSLRIGFALVVLLLFIFVFAAQAGIRISSLHINKATALYSVGLALLLLALLFLNPRGENNFKSGSLLITSIGLLSLVAFWGSPSSKMGPGIMKWARVIAMGLAVSIVGITCWSGKVAWSSAARLHTKHQVDQGYADLIKEIVPPNESILAVVWGPRWYLMTDRKPASGHFYYLPWQAAYNREPVLNRKIDICSDIEIEAPNVVIWDRWRVWGRYDLSDYEPCLYSFLMTNYRAIAGTPLLIHRNMPEKKMKPIFVRGLTLVDLDE